MSFLLTPARRSATTLPSSLTRTFATTSSNRIARMTIVGRVGAEPESNDLANGNKVIKFIIASNSGTRENQTTSWFRVAHFVQPDSKKGDYLMGVPRGSLVYVEGDATMKPYEDSEGKKQTSLNLISTKLEVLKRSQPADTASGI